MLIASFNSHNENASDAGLSRLDTIGGFGLFLFLLFFQLNATVAYVGLAVVGLVFVFQTKTWMPVLKQDPVAQVFLLIVLYILCYSVWASCEFPETAEDQRIAAFNLIHWLFFIPVAWQQFRHRKHINSMLLVLAASLLIRIIVNFDWADVWNLAKVERTGFGLALTVFAPIAGGTVLGLLLLVPSMMSQQPASARWLVGLKASVWLVCLLILLESIVLNQTRGAWLALALVLPVALIVRYKGSLIGAAKISSKSLVILAIIVGLAAFFLHENYATIFNRINAEQVRSEPEVVKMQVEGQEVLMTSSVGYRKILWEIGWRKWKERAFLGWGPGTTEALVKQENNPLLSQSVTRKDGSIETLHLYHLHNLYLEFLVRFGVLGSLPFLALPLLLLAGVWKAQANGSIGWDYACFLFAGWIFMAIMVFFDFQIYKYAWRNYSLIWAALTYAVHLENQRDLQRF